MVKKKKSVKKSNSRPVQTKKKGIALPVVALILNVIILPGLGSLIGGKTKEGIWQLVLAIVGIILSWVLIGIPIIIAAWVWGIVTGIKLIQEAQ